MYDRAKLALRLKEVFAAKGIENKKLAAEITNSKDTLLLKSAEAISPVDTRKELAKLAGIGHDTMHKVMVIEEANNIVLQSAITDKTVSINKAYEITKEVNAEVGAA